MNEYGFAKRSFEGRVQIRFEGMTTPEEKLARALADDWEFIGNPWSLCHLLRAQIFDLRDLVRLTADPRDEMAAVLLSIMEDIDEQSEGVVVWSAPGVTAFERLGQLVASLGHEADLIARFPQFSGGENHGS